MTDLNTIALTGRLGRDAELKYLPDGTPALKFSIAVSRYEKGAGERNETTDWWDVDMIGKRAESVAQYLTKGKRVAVSGSSALRKSKDGEKTYATVKAQEVVLLGSREEGHGEARGGQDESAHRGTRPDAGATTWQEREERQKAAREGQKTPGAQTDDFTDDIPF